MKQRKMTAREYGLKEIERKKKHYATKNEKVTSNFK